MTERRTREDKAVLGHRDIVFEDPKGFLEVVIDGTRRVFVLMEDGYRWPQGQMSKEELRDYMYGLLVGGWRMR